MIDNISNLGRRNRGAFFERTKGKHEQGKREKAFSEEWCNENENFAILSALFIKNEVCTSTVLIEVKPMHRFVAATVIQWLGSSVGFCFLTKALKKAGYQIIKIEDKGD